MAKWQMAKQQETYTLPCKSLGAVTSKRRLSRA